MPAFPEAEAALIGPGRHRLENQLRGGRVTFLGLAPATYEVQIRDQGRLRATRQITFHGPVLADLEIAPAAGSEGGGGRR